MKADLEYINRQWPHTSSIIDLVRCSAVFNTLNDLINGINAFILIVKNNKSGCIKKIVRIKNGFNLIPDLNLDDNIDNNIKLELFDYCDIKMNVIIEYKNVRLIGEIQFIISYMLTAKKQGHSIY